MCYDKQHIDTETYLMTYVKITIQLYLNSFLLAHKIQLYLDTITIYQEEEINIHIYRSISF